MTIDQITKLRIGGLRAIESLEFDLSGLITLIGDNGSGKSSVAEAAEILRHASKSVSHVPDVLEGRHGGLRTLLRRGASELSLGVTIEGAGPRIDYDFAIANVGTHSQVVRENLDVYLLPNAREPLHVLARHGRRTLFFDKDKRKLVSQGTEEPAEDIAVGDQALALPWLRGKAQPAVERALDALDRIDVHVPFETRAVWLHKDLNVNTGPRWPSLLENTQKLSRLGANLPNAFQVLRNRGGETWQRVIDRARLGLGGDVRDFSLSPFGRGMVELEVLFGAFPDSPLPVEALSDGQVAYLCFLALCEFHDSRSLLVFDEPETHLHPNLVARVALMLEEASARAPIVVTTHSNQFLDSLSSPLASVRLCSLDQKRAMQMIRPDANRLAEWLEDYTGLGSIRAAGYEQHVFASTGKEEAR